MGYLFGSAVRAIKLLLPAPQTEILESLFLSLSLSSAATILAFLFAAPLGIFISVKKFKLRNALISFINGWLAVPSVAIGLIVYGFLSGKGPAGRLGWLFTPYAIIAAQTILSFPIILALIVSALKKLAPKTKELAQSLGADKFQTAIAILTEHRHGIIAAAMMGFSRVIGETGMTLMVGGNIKGHTRVLTTLIALETMKGNFEVGIAAGIMLVLVALIINLLLQKTLHPSE